MDGVNLERLKAHIVPLSAAQDFDTARFEWDLIFVEIRVRICNLQSLGGCPLRVSRICPHSPAWGSVVLYRVSQGRTLH